MDFELMYESFFKLIKGIPLTLEVVIISTILGFFLAILVAIMRISNRGYLNKTAYYFVYAVRGTPLLLQIFFIYYGLAQFSLIQESFLWIVLKDPFWCAIIALTLNTCAYSSEIIRGGIQSVSKGYLEAGSALGMGRILSFRIIMLPLAIRQALPAYGNELILMVKASSLVSTVTLMEITGIARKIISQTFAPIEIFLVAGSIYLLINFLITRGIKVAENKLSPDLA
tara:strand:+ start:27 stop:707 length:681 start_codon:yes stop_codon:yes gene_type:complete